ncbi:MAG: hypothetical protein ACFUZC_04990 [Chthoniobacteraceae bacterium]
MSITNTSANQAGAYATGIVSQLNQVTTFVSSANNKVTNGVAAVTTSGIPAVTADEIRAALGTTSTAKIKLLGAALSASDDTKLAAALTALA